MRPAGVLLAGRLSGSAWLVGAVAIGALAGWLALMALRSVLCSPVLRRRNYRQHEVATAGGLALVLAILTIGAGVAVVTAFRPSFRLDGSHSLVILSALGFAFVGLVDDLLASGDDRGFRGHVRAIGEGRWSTGGLKLAGGGALALFAGAGLEVDRAHARLPMILVDAAVIALSANLANLLDRAPGRAVKVSTALFVPLAAIAVVERRGSVIAPVAAVVGATLGILRADLREELMLGDTGVNPLGAVVGLGACAVLGPATRVGVLVGILALNASSEAVSFSSIIDRVTPLRWLDRLGTRPERKRWGATTEAGTD